MIEKIENNIEKIAYTLTLLFAFGTVVSRSLRELAFYPMIALFIFMVIKIKDKNLVLKDKALVGSLLFFLAAIVATIMVHGDFHSDGKNFFKGISLSILLVASIYAFNFSKKQMITIFVSLNIGILINMLYSIYQSTVLQISRTTGLLDVMQLAAVLNFMNIFLLIFTFYSKVSLRIRLSLAALYLVNSTAVIMNGSRGAWVSLFLAIVICLFIHNYKHGLLFMAFIALILVGIVKGPDNYIKYRITSMTNTSSNMSNLTRLHFWEGGYKIFKAHPIAGVGFGNFITYYEKPEFYSGAKDRPETINTHNNIVQLASESGLLGVVSFCTLMLTLLVKLIKVYRNTTDHNEKLFILGGIGVFFLYNLQGMTENNITSSMLMWVFWLMMSIMLFFNKSASLTEGQ